MKKYTLAANYSKELLELIREDIDIVDAVKVSEFNSLDYLNDYSELRKNKHVFQNFYLISDMRKLQLGI